MTNVEINSSIEEIIHKLKSKYNFFEILGVFENNNINIIQLETGEIISDQSIEQYLKRQIEELLKKDVKYLLQLWDQMTEKNIRKKLNIFSSHLDILNVDLDIDFYIELIRKNKEVIPVLKNFTSSNSKVLSNIIFAYKIYTTEHDIKLNDIEWQEIENNLGTISSNYVDSVKIFIQEAKSYPLLNPEEEYQLGLRIMNGDSKAKELLLKSNLRLVISRASGFAKSPLFLDLIQDGNIGLMKAINNFDPTKGYHFSTYATWWIDQGIHRGYQKQKSTIRVAHGTMEENRKLESFKEKFEQEHGYLPTDEDIIKGLKITEEQYQRILLANRDITSINNKIEGYDEVIDTIPDTINIMDIVEERVLSSELWELVRNELLPREYDIIFERIVNKRTHQEIAQKYQISREAIRQIESRSLTKLAKLPTIEHYALFLDSPEQALANVYLRRTKKTTEKRSKKLKNIPEETQKAALEKAKVRLKYNSFLKQKPKKIEVRKNMAYNDVLLLLEQKLTGVEYQVLYQRQIENKEYEDISKLLKLPKKEIIKIEKVAEESLDLKHPLKYYLEHATHKGKETISKNLELTFLVNQESIFKPTARPLVSITAEAKKNLLAKDDLSKIASNPSTTNQSQNNNLTNEEFKFLLKKLEQSAQLTDKEKEIFLFYVSKPTIEISFLEQYFSVPKAEIKSILNKGRSICLGENKELPQSLIKKLSK